MPAGPSRRAGRALPALSWSLAATVAVIVGAFAGLGWLYTLRGLGWFAAGPSIHDSLPLLQLASFDTQPLVRVVLAWALAGVLVGLALSSRPRGRRTAIVLLGALVLLALDSQASYALTRNVNFEQILFSRAPGLGPLVEALAFGAGAALPRRHARRTVGEGGLRGGQNGDAAEHEGDRGQMA